MKTEEKAKAAEKWEAVVTDERQGYKQWKIEPNVAEVYYVNSRGQSIAHLIAAAPELLEALESVVAVADRKTVEFDMARAAIAKAKGLPNG
jgi:hypothetical protein